MPEETIEAFQDHGEVALTLERDVDEAQRRLRAARRGRRRLRRRGRDARARGRREVRRLVRGAARRRPGQARRARLGLRRCAWRSTRRSPARGRRSCSSTRASATAACGIRSGSAVRVSPSRVLRLDLRGFGQTPLEPGRFSHAPRRDRRARASTASSAPRSSASRSEAVSRSRSRSRGPSSSRRSCSSRPGCPATTGRRRRRTPGPRRRPRSRPATSTRRSRSTCAPGSTARGARAGGRRSGRARAGRARCSAARSSSRCRSARTPRKSCSSRTSSSASARSRPTLVIVGDDDLPDMHAIVRAARARDPRCPARDDRRTPRTCRAWSGPASSTSWCSRSCGRRMSTVAPAELVERIWERDPTLWTGHDEAKWLGWLDEPMRMRSRLVDLQRFVEDVAAPGLIDTFVLLGMGGSSLAPEVLQAHLRRRALPRPRHHAPGGDPAPAAESLDLDAHALRRLVQVGDDARDALAPRLLLGARPASAASCFVGDHRPRLRARAARRRSAASAPSSTASRRSAGATRRSRSFGIVPAALMGVDLERLLERVEEMVEACHGEEGNPGLELGLELGNGWDDGRDKVTINPNPGGFGLWAEQLLAESTGKDGKGLIPAPEESPDGPDRQAPEVRLPAPYELGQEFFRWEFATAVAGSILGINPFDQPNVQAAKDKTNEVLAAGGEPDVEPRGLARRAPRRGAARATTSRSRPSSTRRARPELEPLIERARARPAASSRTASARATCTRPASCTRAARTPASSSRSSTTPASELAIPGHDFGFRRLIHAQAAGDLASLEERGRRIVRVRLEERLVQLGMVGLGRMGGNMTKRLEAAGHEMKTYDPHVDSTASSLEELARQLDAPRSVWLMVPAGIVDAVVSGARAAPRGGRHDRRRRQLVLRRRPAPRRRAARARASTSSTSASSGGVWGLERGYCLMVGGDDEAVERLEPVFEALAPASTRPSARRPRRRPRPRGAGLAALRPLRRRPLREDGPQRDRVRAHAGVRRGPERAQAREHRPPRAGDRRRDDAAPRPRPLQVRPRPRGGRRALAPRLRRRVVAARPDRAGARTSRRTWTTTPAASATPARAAGRCRPRSTRACRRRCSRRRCSTASPRAARPTGATGVLSAMRKAFGGHLEKSPEQ